MAAARRAGRTGMRVGAVGWIAAAVGYVVCEGIAAWAMPAYDYAHDYISTLGAPGRSPLAPVMNAAFLAQGVLFPVGAALTVAGVRAATAWAFLAFAVLNGIGNVLVATVHSTPAAGGGPDLHVVGAVLAIAGGNAAVLVGSSAFRRAGASRRYRAASVVLGAVGLACLAGLALDTSLTVLPIGAWERGSVYPIFAWQTLTAVHLLRAPRG